MPILPPHAYVCQGTSGRGKGLLLSALRIWDPEPKNNFAHRVSIVGPLGARGSLRFTGIGLGFSAQGCRYSLLQY